MPNTQDTSPADDFSSWKVHSRRGCAWYAYCVLAMPAPPALEASSTPPSLSLQRGMPWLPAAVPHPCWLVGLFSVLHVACLLCILQSCTSCSANACAYCAQVDLPEDPAVKEMLSHKPAYGAVTTPKADANGKDGEPYALQPTVSSCPGHRIQRQGSGKQAGTSRPPSPCCKASPVLDLRKTT